MLHWKITRVHNIEGLHTFPHTKQCKPITTTGKGKLPGKSSNPQACYTKPLNISAIDGPRGTREVPTLQTESNIRFRPVRDADHKHLHYQPSGWPVLV